MRLKRSEAYRVFLDKTKTPANADLVEDWCFDDETQVNVSPDGGEPVAGKRSTWSDGINEWGNARTPKCVEGTDGTVKWQDYEQHWPLELRAVGIGITGWRAKTRRSRGMGFDFDDLTTHAKNVGISGEELEAVKEAAQALDYVTTRRSTSGSGLHLWVHFEGEGVPTDDHNQHAALARLVLKKMSDDTQFDFTAAVDCAGSVMWIWHRKMTPENHGLEIIKRAARKLRIDELPPDWEETIKVKKTSKSKSKRYARYDEGAEGGLDAYEKLATSRRTIPLEPSHKAQLDALMEMANFTTIWLGDMNMCQVHSCALNELMADPATRTKLKLIGYYKSDSDGRDPGSPNAFMFPLPGGAWAVFRFGPGVGEDVSWEQDGTNWTRTYFNRLPDLKTAARIHGGNPDDKQGEFVFTTATEALEAAEALGVNLEVPDGMEARQTRLKPSKDGELVMEIARDKKDDPNAMRGWIAKPGRWFRRLAVTAIQEDAGEIPEEVIDDRPVIQIGPDMARVADLSIEALTSDESIFQRGDLVMLQVPAKQPSQYIGKTGGIKLVLVDAATLKLKLSEVARYERWDDKAADWVWCKPEMDVVEAIIARRSYRGIRVCTGIVASPLLRIDGTVANTPGYDPETGIYFDLTGDFPGLMDRFEAVRLLKEVFCDFPFKDDRHMSAAISALVTLVSRQAFRGSSPFNLIDSNSSGTGKNLLLDAMMIISEGIVATRYSMPSAPDELQKYVTSVLLAGGNYVVVDNIKTKLGGAVLEKITTSERDSGRVLGQSKSVDLPSLLTWFGTGNNVTTTRDMGRRICYIRLVTDKENPDTREETEFTHPNLLGFVGDSKFFEKGEWHQGNRRQLIMAALSIPAAYIKDGRPRQEMTPWGSFEQWSNLVRASLIYAGLPDCDTHAEARVSVDEETNDRSELFDAMAEIAMWPKTITAAEAIKLSCQPSSREVTDFAAPKLAALLESTPAGKRKDKLSTMLRDAREAIVGDLQLLAIDPKSKRDSRTWSVKNVGQSGEAILWAQLIVNIRNGTVRLEIPDWPDEDE